MFKKTTSIILLFTLTIIFCCTPVNNLVQAEGFGDDLQDVGTVVDSGNNSQAVKENILNTNIQENQELTITDIDSELINIVGLLHELEIMKVTSDGKFNPKAVVTRAELAVIISKALGMTEGMDIAVKFNDVTSEHAHARAISLVTHMEIMQGEGESFKPDEGVTMERAVKAVVSMLGYDLYARQKGNYPLGYMITAREIGIFRETRTTDSTQQASRESIAKLIYNALEVELMDIAAIGSSIDLAVRKGENLLSKNFEISKGEGIVTGKYETSIYKGESNLKSDLVTIDDVIYNIGKTTARKWLGYKVEYYYKNNQTTNTLLFVAEKRNSNNSLTVKGEEIIQISGRKLAYSSEPDSSVRNISLANSMALIYNDKLLAYNTTDENKLEDLLKISDGYMIFIDNNKDDVYDICFVYEFDTYVVDQVFPSQKTVNFKYPVNGQNSKNIDLEDDDTIISIVKNNEPIGLSSLNEWDVMSVLESHDYSQGKKVIKAVVTNTVINGKITEVWSDSEGIKCVIAEKTYKLTNDFEKYIKDNPNNGIKVDSAGGFCIDAMNRIAGINTTLNNQNKRYAYLFNIALEKGLQQQPKMQLFTENGQFEIFEFANNIEISYYPRYAPWAAYRDTSPMYYVDPVVLKDYNFHPIDHLEAYMGLIFLKVSGAGGTQQIKFPFLADEGKAIYRRHYQETGRAKDLIIKYFYDYEGVKFDTEKMQLIRYEIDSNRNITKIETAKDYGLSINRIVENTDEIKQDVANDVFRLSYKANMYKSFATSASTTFTSILPSNPGLGVWTQAYRFIARGMAWLECLLPPSDYHSRPVATTVDVQPTLLNMDKKFVIFNIPRHEQLNTTNIQYVGNSNHNKVDMEKMRSNKNFYSIDRTVATSNINRVIDGYNHNDLNTVSLFINYVTPNLSNASSTLCVVDRVVSYIDGYGNVAQKLYGYHNGELKMFEGETDFVFTRKISDQPLKQGDIVRLARFGGEPRKYNITNQVLELHDDGSFRLFSDFNVTSMSNVLSKEELAANPNNIYFHNREVECDDYDVTSRIYNGNKDRGFGFARVLGINQNFIKLDFSESSVNGVVSRVLDGSFICYAEESAKVIVVDRLTRRASVGSYSDVSNGDHVYVRLEASRVMEIVVYKD